MNQFYVYEHVRNDTGETFYVGKGSKGRAHREHGRNPHWRNIAAKAGYSVRFLAEGLSEELAFLVEIERISQMKAIGRRLVNLTDGGDGVSGYEPTPEYRALRSKIMTGRKHSDATKAKIAAARTGKTVPDHVKQKFCGDNSPMKRLPQLREAFTGSNNPMFGKTLSVEARKRISESNTGRVPSAETLRRRSESLSGEKNPMFGKTHSAESRELIGSYHTGDRNAMRRPEVAALFSGERNPMRNPEVAAKVAAALRAKPRISCPHCGKVGAQSQMKRWHLDNCRERHGAGV